jgi:hypothetical protein
MVRIGIIGARRARQGIGQHVARHLAALGAKVVAVAGTRQETAEEACWQLKQRCRIHPAAYVSLSRMFAEQALDAVAVCSPHEVHGDHLREALAARVHVLCEKPLVFNPDRDPAAVAAPLIEGFANSGKVLMTNEQWPYSLPAFGRLFPDYVWRPPKLLAMLLSPDATGPEMIPNALPHVLSLLFALAPPGGYAEQIRVLFRDGDASADAAAAEIHIDYRHAADVTHVRAQFQRAALQPRPAGYQIDDYIALRRIDLPGYYMTLQAAQALSDGVDIADTACPKSQVEMEDPLRLLVADFLNRCERAQRGAEVKKDTTILQRLAILRDVYKSACEAFRSLASGGRQPQGLVTLPRTVDASGLTPPARQFSALES